MSFCKPKAWKNTDPFRRRRNIVALQIKFSIWSTVRHESNKDWPVQVSSKNAVSAYKCSQFVCSQIWPKNFPFVSQNLLLVQTPILKRKISAYFAFALNRSLRFELHVLFVSAGAQGLCSAAYPQIKFTQFSYVILYYIFHFTWLR